MAAVCQAGMGLPRLLFGLTQTAGAALTKSLQAPSPARVQG
jgi:hypothetical protein